MFAKPFDGHRKKKYTRCQHRMSYTFGPHTKKTGDHIYYAGDNRVVHCDPDKIPKVPNTTPHWVVAGWMLARQRGEPLSTYANLVLGQCVPDESIAWLAEYLHQLPEQ